MVRGFGFGFGVGGGGFLGFSPEDALAGLGHASWADSSLTIFRLFVRVVNVILWVLVMLVILLIKVLLLFGF